MKKSQRQIVYEKAEKYAKKHLKKIDVVMGDYDGGQKCQHVARHRLETEGCSKLVVTLAFVPNSGVNLHMINFCNGRYIDHVLGYLSKRNTYYLIKEYKLEEIKDEIMSKFLMHYKEKILDKLFTEKEKKELKINLTHI